MPVALFLQIAPVLASLLVRHPLVCPPLEIVQYWAPLMVVHSLAPLVTLTLFALFEFVACLIVVTCVVALCFGVGAFLGSLTGLHYFPCFDFVC